MKKLTLLASLLALALGASAQSHQSVGPVAIPPNARGGARTNAVGVTTTTHPAAAVQSSAAAAKPASNGGPQAPPIAKVPPHVVPVPPIAKK